MKTIIDRATRLMSCFLLIILPTAVFAGGPAVNQFEVKDLDVEVGKIEFQSQNAHSFGQPRRLFVEEDPGEFEFDENTVVRQRHALELEFGVTTFFRTRLGVEFEKERLEEPSSFGEANAFDSLVLEELAVEGVFVFAPVPESGGIGLGALIEYQYPIETSEPQSIVFGPIVQASYGDWQLVLNPTVVQFFGGSEDERDNKLDFFYAAQLLYNYSDTWDLALEAYGTVDRLGNTGRRSEESQLFGDFDQHRLGPIVYYNFDIAEPPGLERLGRGTREGFEDDSAEDEIEVSLGVGVLFGLNQNTPDTTLKWSIEAEF